MPASEVSIAAADGTAAAWFFTPQSRGKWPAALMFMDALGIRPAMMAMAERLAGEGYAFSCPICSTGLAPRRPSPWAISPTKNGAQN